MANVNIYGIHDEDCDEWTVFSCKTDKQACARFVGFLQSLPPMSDSDDYKIYRLSHVDELINLHTPQMLNPEQYEWKSVQRFDKRDRLDEELAHE